MALPQAARRLYTADGMMILDLDDLIKWVQDKFVEEAQEHILEYRKAKREGRKPDKGTNITHLLFLMLKDTLFI